MERIKFVVSYSYSVKKNVYLQTKWCSTKPHYIATTNCTTLCFVKILLSQHEREKDYTYEKTEKGISQKCIKRGQQRCCLGFFLLSFCFT